MAMKKLNMIQSFISRNLYIEENEEMKHMAKLLQLEMKPTSSLK